MLANSLRSIVLRSRIANTRQIVAASSKLFFSQKVASSKNDGDKKAAELDTVKRNEVVRVDSKNNKVVYTQGQEYQDLREYFFYIDNHGQLFLDDTEEKSFVSCYKEQKFLEYFFKSLRANDTKRFDLIFPFVSHTEDEVSYLRCEDLPFVVTHLDENNSMIGLNHISSAHWLFHFDPEKLYYNPRNARLYYLFDGKEIIRGQSVARDDPKRLKHLDHLPCRLALIQADIGSKLMARMHQDVERTRKEGGQTASFAFEFKSKSYMLNVIGQNEQAASILKKFSTYGKEV